MLPADNHAHSQWSWDAPGHASMERACERAVALGLPSIAFTEHLDFEAWGAGDRPPGGSADLRERFSGRLDLAGYRDCLNRCRELFPGLRIRSGLEAGEPHLFAASLAAVLRSGEFERVLGSLHSVTEPGRMMDVGAALAERPPGQPAAEHAAGVMRRYFAELVEVIEGSDVFEVLAHVDYPRRYWPAGIADYDEGAFEPEYRAVFRALARSGRVLEFNTRSPLASVRLLTWWRAEGGTAVSFGSDAHAPDRVAARFRAAMDIAASAGFQPGRDPLDFWRR